MKKTLSSSRSQLISSQGFDYDSVAASIREDVQEETRVIREMFRTTARYILQIGLRLQFVRNCLGPHRFQEWIRLEFGLSQPSASKYMRVARHFASADCLENFQPSALYKLAQRSVTSSVRERALILARRGEIVTTKCVESLLGNDQAPAHAKHIGDFRTVRNYIETVASNLASDGDIDALADELAALSQQLRDRVHGT